MPLAPKNAEPWKELEASAQRGFKSGVRLGSAMYALAAYSKGDNERMRKALCRQLHIRFVVVAERGDGRHPPL